MDMLWTVAVWVIAAFAALWTLAGGALLVAGVLRRDRADRRRGWLYLGAGLGLLPFALIMLADEVALLVLPGLAVSAGCNWLLGRDAKRRRAAGAGS
ncbi:hypothetical protein O7606_24585 [Micromonospora sp. WMMD882]|uniref:hypothetical protein n=1 Tax=Micromonospora sp. WMMD882 TaxID=3015151 RepID=UPI00248BF080|nr:hypothetical protein [Micromonospora sp. WMMD882]WBB79310.1 hypothetical protein O7606_24585 [Micromonospora sp. WMMD882]